MTDRGDRVWYVHGRQGQRGPFAERELGTFATKSGAHRHPPTKDAEPSLGFSASLAKYAFNQPLRVFRDAWSIVARGHEFSERYIEPTQTATVRSIDFYITAFTVSFAFLLVGASFLPYSGITEIRSLAGLVCQLAIAFFPLHLMLTLIVGKLSWRETLQYMLYADGAFIMVANAFSLTVAGIEQHLTWGPTRAPNIISNEFEKCLADSSWLYWMLRGKLEFVLLRDDRLHNDLVELLREYFDFIILAPFLVAFGRMVEAKHPTKWYYCVVPAALAFVLATQGFSYVMGKAQQALSANSPCWETAPETITKKYQRDELLAQIDVKINNDLQAIFGRSSAFSIAHRHEAFYVIFTGGLDSLQAELGEEKIKAQTSSMIKPVYCSRSTTFWVMRLLGQGLAVAHMNDAGQQTFVVYLRPADCSDSSPSFF